MASMLTTVLQWLVGIGFVWALLWQLLRWRIDLFIRCTEKVKNGVTVRYYTCALHNAEDHNLDAPFALEIAIDEAGAGFDRDHVHVYVDQVERPSGCRIEQRDDTSGAVVLARSAFPLQKEKLVIEANGMRSKETWYVRFQSAATPKNVFLRVVSREGTGGTPWAFPVVQRQELRAPGVGNVSTGSGTSRNATRIIVGLAGSWFYIWAVVQRTGGWAAPRNWHGAQIYVDLMFAAALFGAAYIMMKVSWRLGVPFIQGYLEEIVGLEKCASSKSGATPQQTARS